MINIIKHPLVSSKLTKMRMKDTPSAEFAKTIHELASFMTYEVTKFNCLHLENMNIRSNFALWFSKDFIKSQSYSF